MLGIQRGTDTVARAWTAWVKGSGRSRVGGSHGPDGGNGRSEPPLQRPLRWLHAGHVGRREPLAMGNAGFFLSLLPGLLLQRAWLLQ